MSLYGLIGYPLEHSFSAAFFRQKWEKENIAGYQYDLFPLSKISDLPALIKSRKNLNGFNVTAPYKQSVIPLLDSLSEEAGSIGAVNTVKITRTNGREFLTGYNTDIYGIMNVIKGLNNKPGSALIMGNGGAAASLRYVLNRLNIPYTIVSRQPYGGVIGYESVTAKIISSHTLIINCTPVGTEGFGQAKLKIPFESLGNGHVLFDMTYNPAVTHFMKEGLKRGATVVNGYPMLTAQALKAWEIWEPTLSAQA